MTTAICWAALDSRGPSSLYIATDSRISWSSTAYWDCGKKLRVDDQEPVILAFAGDVTFGHNLLLGMSQNRIDYSRLDQHLNLSSNEYPSELIEKTKFIAAQRHGEGMSSQFTVTTYEFIGRSWSATNHSVPTEHSDIVCAYGSGRHIALDELKKWMKQDVSGRTSRSVFSAFCDALRSGRDHQTGGPPQLGAIYRCGSSQEIGIVWDNQLYLGGERPSEELNLATIKWYNDLFEACDPNTLKRRAGAQPHARPKTLTRPSQLMINTPHTQQID